MLHPEILCILLSFDARQAAIAQVLEAIGDPVHVLLARQYHLTFDAGALRTGDHEQVGEAGYHDPEIGTWTAFPLFPDRQPCIGMDTDFLYRTGHRVKTGRK